MGGPIFNPAILAISYHGAVQKSVTMRNFKRIPHADNCSIHKSNRESLT